jgi:hypothetical protein
MLSIDPSLRPQAKDILTDQWFDKFFPGRNCPRDLRMMLHRIEDALASPDAEVDATGDGAN